MRITKLIILAIFILTSCANTGQKVNYFKKNGVKWNSSDQVFILFRHAEKKTGENPTLTEQGTKRAKRIVNLVEGIQVNNIFSTDYPRTLETVAPLSKKRLIKPIIYDPTDLAAFALELLDKDQGIYAISGHSNTTAVLANSICDCEDFSAIDESDYGNIFIVVVSKDDSKTYQLRY